MLCPWVKDEFDRAYHDGEWGVPQRSDPLLFELLVLETMQAGLSWNLILRRRENMRRAFSGFEAARIAQYGEEERAALLQNAGIIRNARKINALVQNARAFLAVQEEYGAFHRFIWQFTGGTPLVNHRQTPADVPAQSPESQAMSKVLRARGFAFVGPVVCYSYMQAIGMVNDHLTSCPAFETCRAAAAGIFL